MPLSILLFETCGRVGSEPADGCRMSSSREQSPEWLRSYQVPNKSYETLSLSSSSPEDIPGIEGENDYDDNDDHKVISDVLTCPKRMVGRNQEFVLIGSEDAGVAKSTKLKTTTKIMNEVNDNILLQGIDSDEETSVAMATKLEATPKVYKEEGDGCAVEAVEEEILEKIIEPQVSSTLPLVFPDKVQRSKALVECEGESLDMSGDVGAVGRVAISDNTTGQSEVLLDLKGTVFKTTIIPSRTFCIVSFGQSEAKIEAVMNDFIRLKPCSNVFECETMVEGTLEGFSFDSEEDGENIPKTSICQGDKNNKDEDPSNSKSKKRKEKSLVVPRKRAKPSGKGKISKKPQAQKNFKKLKK